jgi:hypothetical protein
MLVYLKSKSFNLRNNKKLLNSFSLKIAKADQAIKNYPFEREHLPDETIFLIDGTSILYRSYFSSKSSNKYPNAKLTDEISAFIRKNAKYSEFEQENGPINCSALITMASKFVNLLDTIKPRYAAVIFDAGGETFRNNLYPEYKQNRKKVLLYYLVTPYVKYIFSSKLQCIWYDSRKSQICRYCLT